MPEQEGCLSIGLDLGAARVKVAVLDSGGRVIHTCLAPARADCITVLAALLRNLPLQCRTVRAGVTGVGRTLWPPSLACVTVNEIAAAAAAVKRRLPGVRSVIEIGGQSSKWIRLGADETQPVADFSTNGLCAAGAGVFLEQQAARLGMTAQALGEMAAAAPRGATVAGRCSVFAKSDMIHLQQKGTPREDIAYGLCQALVRTFASSVLQGRSLELPVALVGGSASNAGLIRALREHFHFDDDSLIVPCDAAYLCAFGAAWQASGAPPLELSTLLAGLEHKTAGHRAECGASRLPPLGGTARPNEPVEREEPAAAGPVEVIIGIDVGSVSTDLVVLDRRFQVLQGVYLPTRGQPLEALREGLDAIRQRFGERVRVLAVGSTGSGRHLAARIAGADVVRNEITAQAVSSAHYYPGVDTIFEIGGQDSKFISMRDGLLVDFEMNKICSGGTGSFLEEQAERLGIRIEGEFSDRAFQSAAPYNLGSRCTVFMDSELVRARECGVPVEDLCAGLAYSVARNYIEKVVAGRPVGERIVFQGGTASNRAVVAAFGRLLGCEVAVHPYNRLSGAIGAALLAAREMPARSRFAGFDACASAAVKSFECRHCDNRCQVNRVSAGSRIVHFGDVCERYSERDGNALRRPRPFPEMFAERDRLFEESILPEEESSPGAEASGERIGLLRASLNWEYLPFWAEFLRRLGFAPVVAPRVTSEMLERSAGALPPDVCLPVKVAVAQAAALLESGTADRVFVPALIEFPGQGAEARSHACLFTQELPNLVRNLRDSRIVTAPFVFEDGLVAAVESCVELGEMLGRSPIAVRRALLEAGSRQQRFAEARSQLGRVALASDFDRAVVVLGRPYNAYDPLLNLSLAKQLDRVGLAAVPWDLLPLAGVRIPARWRTIPWRYCREQIRAVHWLRRDPRLFALMVSNFGCGPDAFAAKHIEELLRGKPHLLLEFDEHRGEAGLTTRLEAFADEIDAYSKSRRPIRRAAAVTPGPRAVPVGRNFFVAPFSEHARMYAAALRAAGYEAEVLPDTDDESLRLGERYCSGRECHPYVLLAGDLVRFLKARAQPGDVFVLPGCAQPCLIRQYGDAMRILRGRLSAPGPEIWEANGEALLKVVGVPGLARLYEGFLGADLLMTLAARLRPYAITPGRIRRLLGEALADLEDVLSARGDGASAVGRAAALMWAEPRMGRPGDRPIVGVTGDLYTRVNEAGNHHLMERLEAMGCEVWLGASWAANSDLANTLDAPRAVGQGRFRDLALEGLAWVVTERIRQRMKEALPPEVRPLVIDPSPRRTGAAGAALRGPGDQQPDRSGCGQTGGFPRTGRGRRHQRGGCELRGWGLDCCRNTGHPRGLPGCAGHQPLLRGERRACRQDAARDLRPAGQRARAASRRLKKPLQKLLPPDHPRLTTSFSGTPGAARRFRDTLLSSGSC